MISGQLPLITKILLIFTSFPLNQADTPVSRYLYFLDRAGGKRYKHGVDIAFKVAIIQGNQDV